MATSIININGITVDGNDFSEVYTKTKDAIEYARNGKPTFIECRTFSNTGHYLGEKDAETMEQEPNTSKYVDPIKKMEALLEMKGTTREDITKMRKATSVNIKNVFMNA